MSGKLRRMVSCALSQDIAFKAKSLLYLCLQLNIAAFNDAILACSNPSSKFERRDFRFLFE